MIVKFAVGYWVEHISDKSAHGRIVFFVRVNPAGMDFGFVKSLRHIRLNARNELSINPRWIWIERPGADQCLIQKILFISVGDFDILSFLAVALVHLFPL